MAHKKKYWCGPCNEPIMHTSKLKITVYKNIPELLGVMQADSGCPCSVQYCNVNLVSFVFTSCYRKRDDWDVLWLPPVSLVEKPSALEAAGLRQHLVTLPTFVSLSTGISRLSQLYGDRAIVWRVPVMLLDQLFGRARVAAQLGCFFPSEETERPCRFSQRCTFSPLLILHFLPISLRKEKGRDTKNEEKLGNHHSSLNVSEDAY